MTVTEIGIITLLKSAVTGRALQLPADFDLEKAYDLVKKHHMVPMIYDGAVRCGVDKKAPVMQKLFQGYLRAMLTSEKQMRQLERVFDAFERENIDYLPLKGCKMKALYPKPELRVMGDADVLIRLEQYDKIKPVMESLGFSAQKDSDHELVWTADGLYLELHKRLIPSYNEDFHRYYGDSWRFAGEKSGSRYSMTPEDEFTFQFTHFAKHYRDGGIGCRYVVDLWVFLRAHPQMNRQTLRQELEKLQLWEFYENIRRLIAVWFENAQTDEKTDFITDFIFSSGSWGCAESKTASIGVRDMGQTGNSARSKAKYVWRTAFPDVQTLKFKYTVLQKAPALLPVVWLVRPFYKVLFERESLRRHNKALQALTPENLKTRRDALNYVGLDYHF